jgi:hypothetical protein
MVLIYLVHLIYMVSRRFRATSQIRSSSNASLNLAPERSISALFYVRVGIFMLFSLLMSASTVFQSFDTNAGSPVSDMLFAGVAPLAFVCFATQVSTSNDRYDQQVHDGAYLSLIS